MQWIGCTLFQRLHCVTCTTPTPNCRAEQRMGFMMYDSTKQLEYLVCRVPQNGMRFLSESAGGNSHSNDECEMRQFQLSLEMRVPVLSAPELLGTHRNINNNLARIFFSTTNQQRTERRDPQTRIAGQANGQRKVSIHILIYWWRHAAVYSETIATGINTFASFV